MHFQHALVLGVEEVLVEWSVHVQLHMEWEPVDEVRRADVQRLSSLMMMVGSGGGVVGGVEEEVRLEKRDVTYNAGDGWRTAEKLAFLSIIRVFTPSTTWPMHNMRRKCRVQLFLSRLVKGYFSNRLPASAPP